MSEAFTDRELWLEQELSTVRIELEMQIDEMQKVIANNTSINHRYLSLFNYAPVSIFILNPEGIVLNRNPKSELILHSRYFVDKDFQFEHALASEDRMFFRDSLKKITSADNPLNSISSTVTIGERGKYVKGTLDLVSLPPVHDDSTFEIAALFHINS